MNGKVNIAVVGDSYAKNEQSLFLSDLENIKQELFIRLWQRQSQFNFIPVSYQNNFQCKESTMWEGSTCNEQAVLKSVKGVSYDAILVIAKKLMGGGGGSICIAGSYFHDRLHSGEIGVHELAHTLFGLQHDGAFMNSSCNHGACGWNATFTPAQFNTINQRLNQMAGALPSVPIAINIDNTSIIYSNTGNTLIAHAKATGLVQWIEVFVDDVSKGIFMYWGNTDRTPYSNPSDGIKFFMNPITPGKHILKMIATDINSQTAMTSIEISVLITSP